MNHTKACNAIRCRKMTWYHSGNTKLVWFLSIAYYEFEGWVGVGWSGSSLFGPKRKGVFPTTTWIKWWCRQRPPPPPIVVFVVFGVTIAITGHCMANNSLYLKILEALKSTTEQQHLSIKVPNNNHKCNCNGILPLGAPTPVSSYWPRESPSSASLAS